MKKFINLLILFSLLLLSGCGKEKYVTFIYNDNVHDDQKCKITEGRINCKINEPTKEGYTFLGWYDENDNYVDPNGVFNKDITLYPEYSKNKNAEKEEDKKYVIAFDLNDGYGTMPTVEVEYGKKLSDLSKIPTRNEYIFKGFYDKKDYTKGVQYYDENGKSVRNFDRTTNIALYARWEKKEEPKQETAVNTEPKKDSIARVETKKQETTTKEETKKEEPKQNTTTKVETKKEKPKQNTTTNVETKKTETKQETTKKEETKKTETKQETTNVETKKTETKQETTKKEETKKTETKQETTKKEETKKTETKQETTKKEETKKTETKQDTTKKEETKKTETKQDTTKEEETKKTETKQDTTQKEETKKTETKQETTKKEETKKTEPKQDTKKIDPIPTYTITYNSNGGTGEMKTQSVTGNATLSSNTYKREGYTFLGWNTKSDGTGTSYKDKDTIKLTGNITLYAMWKVVPPTTYEVSFNSNGGSGGQTANVKATYGKPMPTISTTAPTRSGYIFTGWYDKNGTKYYDEKGASVKNFDLKIALVLYAGWYDKNTFTVKYDCNGGTNAPADHQVKNGETFAPKASTCTRPGYIFDGWYTKPVDGSNWTFNVAKANFDSKNWPNNTITLYAHWDKELKTNSVIKPDSSKYKYVGKCTDLIGSNIMNMSINQYCSYESDTLKYYIIKQNRYIITYVWAKDAYNQFKMGVPAVDPNPSSSRKNNNYGNTKILQYNWLGRDIMENEIKQNNYENKGLVGFNASAMIAQQWVTDSYKQNVPTGWYGQTHINIYRVNGETIRASYDKYKYNTIIYGLANDGSLKYFKSNYNSDVYVAGNDLNKQYIEDVYKIKNTFGFSPVLVEKGQKVVNNNDKNMREAICQKDKNNFAFITSTSSDRDNGLSYNDMANMMVSMGCYTGFNLDGGGSTSYFYKSNAVKNNNNSGFYRYNTNTDLVGPGEQHGVAYKYPGSTQTETRVSADIIYFVEQ